MSITNMQWEYYFSNCWSLIVCVAWVPPCAVLSVCCGGQAAVSKAVFCWQLGQTMPLPTPPTQPVSNHSPHTSLEHTSTSRKQFVYGRDKHGQKIISSHDGNSISSAVLVRAMFSSIHHDIHFPRMMEMHIATLVGQQRCFLECLLSGLPCIVV